MSILANSNRHMKRGAPHFLAGGRTHFIGFFVVASLLVISMYFVAGTISSQLLQRVGMPVLTIGSDQEFPGWKTIYVYVGNSSYGDNRQRRPG